MTSHPPEPAQLIRSDPTWLYQGWHGTLAARDLQVWATGPGRVVAVVTEHPGDTGTSITNATEHIHAQLAAEYPDQQIEVIEHYTTPPPPTGEAAYQRWTLTADTADTGDAVEFPPAAETRAAETWDRVTLTEHGYPRWQPLSGSEVADLLGTHTTGTGDDLPLPDSTPENLTPTPGPPTPPHPGQGVRTTGVTRWQITSPTDDADRTELFPHPGTDPTTGRHQTERTTTMTDPTAFDPTAFDPAAFDPTAHDPAASERVGEAVSYTWVPTAAEQHTIEAVREYTGHVPTGPSPRQALDFAAELHAEQTHASLEAAAQGDLINGWAAYDLDPDHHNPAADAARTELAALDRDLAADHAPGLDEGPDLSEDLGL